MLCLILHDGPGCRFPSTTNCTSTILNHKQKQDKCSVLTLPEQENYHSRSENQAGVIPQITVSVNDFISSSYSHMTCYFHEFLGDFLTNSLN
jgi:hypothetical protein